MRKYSDIITLTQNQRGVYSLDTVFGCKDGILYNAKGCYNDCYSARIAKKYGYDFGMNVLRNFKDDKHRLSIINKINKVELPFIRIGSNGDPSGDWDHTIRIISNISECKKKIVIITKHWNLLTDKQILQLSKYNIVFNNSISALDNPELRNIVLTQHKRLKKRFKSVLRVISCDFNKDNKDGLELSKIQDELLQNNAIDTVFRLFKNNDLYKNNIVNISKELFLGKKCIVSRNNKNTYFGNCNSCVDMCGVNDKLYFKERK